MGSDPGNPYASGPLDQARPATATGDATHGVIPYKNPQALIGYYLGVGSLIPGLGLLFAIPAVVLGILGLLKYRKTPVVKGQVHAIVAIVLGTGGVVVWGGCLVAILFGALANSF